MKSYFKAILFLIVSVAYGCKKPYNPPVIITTGSYFVAQRGINVGYYLTIITLSHIADLSISNVIDPVK